MENHIPFDTGEQLDFLGLGEDFLDMMQMSQSVEPFAFSYQDMYIDSEPTIGNRTSSLFGEAYPEPDYSSTQNQTFATVGHTAEIIDVYDPMDGAYVADEDFSIFLNNNNQTEYQTTYENPTNPQQIDPLETSDFPIPAQNPAARKRKLEDGLSQFVGVKNSGRKTRQRKSFAPDRRKEVDQVRKVGACLRCRITKARVGPASCCLKEQLLIFHS
jgi:hypothetical protein